MKALKIDKIQWNFAGMTEAQITAAKTKLPNVIKFTAGDNFDVTSLAKKIETKYGCPVDGYTHTFYRVANDVEELLAMCAEVGEKEKVVFTGAGKLSAYGNRCFRNFKDIIKKRIQLEEKGVKTGDMPVLYDEVILSVEKITNLSWDDDPFDEIIQSIINKVRNRYDNKGFDSDYDSFLDMDT